MIDFLLTIKYEDVTAQIESLLKRRHVPSWGCYHIILSRNINYNKHDTLKQCWFNVGPESQAVGQHLTNI